MRDLLPVAVSRLAGAVIARCDPQRCDTTSKGTVSAVSLTTQASMAETDRGGRAACRDTPTNRENICAVQSSTKDTQPMPLIQN